MEKMTGECIAECRRLGIDEKDCKADVAYCEKMAKEGVSPDVKKQANLLHDLLHLQITN